MKSSNRDLLVLLKKVSDERELEIEVGKLHELLLHTESMLNFCLANEIIDINKYKIVRTSSKIEKIIDQKLKPFQFVCNKN